jgi:two-component system chemotaxis response regulator CheB
VSIVTKPKVGLKDFLQDSSNDIVDAVKAAARANIGNLRPACDGAGYCHRPAHAGAV